MPRDACPSALFYSVIYGFCAVLFEKSEHQCSDYRACDKCYDIEKRMVANYEGAGQVTLNSDVRAPATAEPTKHEGITLNGSDAA